MVQGLGMTFSNVTPRPCGNADFFSKKVVSATGLRDLFALVSLHVETRRVFISPATYNPYEAWVLEQSEAFKQHLKGGTS